MKSYHLKTKGVNSKMKTTAKKKAPKNSHPTKSGVQYVFMPALIDFRMVIFK